jgi:hypothetical protein
VLRIIKHVELFLNIIHTSEMLQILLVFSVIEHAVAREPIHHARRGPLLRLLLVQLLYNILSQVVHIELFK